MFDCYRLHAILFGKFSRRGIQAWLDANSEGECQIDERENKLTKTYTVQKFQNLPHEIVLSDIQIR